MFSFGDKIKSEKIRKNAENIADVCFERGHMFGYMFFYEKHTKLTKQAV